MGCGTSSAARLGVAASPSPPTTNAGGVAGPDKSQTHTVAQVPPAPGVSSGGAQGTEQHGLGGPRSMVSSPEGYKGTASLPTAEAARKHQAVPSAEPEAGVSIAASDSSSIARGLTLRGLRLLKARLQQLCDMRFFAGSWTLHGAAKEGVESFAQLTTEQVIFCWVEPEVNVKGDAALADALHAALPDLSGMDEAPEALVAPVTYFISHAWKGRISKLFEVVEAFLFHAADTTAVWLDFVAIDQRSDDSTSNEQALQSFVSKFDQVLHSCPGGVLVVADMSKTDSNPATRAWCTFEWDHCLDVHGPDGLHMYGLSIHDKQQILQSINQREAKCSGERGPEMLAMINGDIERHHGSLSAFDTRLKLQLLLDPLSYKVDVEQLTRRSSGTKWRWEPVHGFLAQQPQDGHVLCFLAGAGTGKSSISAALAQQVLGRQDSNSNAWLGPATAVHFAKHSDQRRLDPVRIIKSLTYQLAVRLAPAADALLQLSAKAVAKLRQPEDAFEQLLLPTLTCTQEPVVLLIDALDEADPPDEQRPDFDSMKATVKACGNAVLNLLVSQLAPRLPANVKLILTTRPDACCRGIQAVLTRAFPSGVLFLQPGDVRDDSADDPAASKVLVYDAVVRECGLSHLPFANEGGSTLDNLHTAYRAVFERSPPQELTSVLMRLLLSAQEPLSTSLLQQLGIGTAELHRLPGWSCLFYEAEHHIYMLHKSLSDWLLLPLDNNPFAPDIVAGHKALGEQLLKDAVRVSNTAQASDYCLKYVALHLCQAGPDCGQLLDTVLSHWDFLRAAIKAGHGGKLLSALGQVSLNQWSAYAVDAFRWLARFINDFESKPESMEGITINSIGVPLNCFKFQEALAAAQPPWLPRLQLGGYGNDWPPDTSTLKGHTESITSVAFSPDGKQLATGSGDESAKVWDLATGNCTATLTGHCDLVTSVAFSPDGKQLATGSMDETAKMWDLASGTCTATLIGRSSHVTSVVFSPDSKQLVTGHQAKTAKVWDLASSTCVSTLTGHTDSVASVAFSSDGKLLATGSRDATAKVWDLARGTCTATLQGHNRDVLSVAFSRDDRQLATGSRDSTAKVWDTASGAVITTLEGHNHFVTSVAFGPCGKQLATGSMDNTAKVWDLDTSTCTVTLQGHTRSVNGVVFSHDGRQLATGSADTTAKVWDMANSARITALGGHNDRVTSMAFSPNGKQLATGSMDTTVNVWDMDSGTCTATLKGHNDSVTKVTFSPDGKQLATGSADSTVKVWDLANGSCTATLTGNTDSVLCVAFSPDGKQVATGSMDSIAKVWDLASGTCTATQHCNSSQVNCIAFSFDANQLATGSMDNTAKVWDLVSSACIATLKGHKNPVWGMSFSPDGKQLATGSRDKTAKIWDLASGRCSVTLKGHDDTVLSVAFNLDGKQLVTGSGDDSAKVWDLATGACTATLQGHSNSVWSVAFSPDGKQLATGTGGSIAKVWELISST